MNTEEGIAREIHDFRNAFFEAQFCGDFVKRGGGWNNRDDLWLTPTKNPNQESLGDKHAIMWMHVGPALLLLLYNTRNAWLVLKNFSSSSSSSHHRIGEEKAEESGAAS
jgi:hypothetical protein